MSITSRIATIEVAEIRPDRGNRPLSSTHVRDLATSFGHTTFATAVVVRPLPDDDKYRWEPVAGFHRIEAARQSGQTQVHAIVIEDANDVQLELIRLHENLLHRPLTPVQEAKAMARTRDIYQMLTPGTRRGGDRRAKTQNAPLSFADATAAATGRSKSAINRAAARGDQIASDVLNTVQSTALDSGAFLDKLAKVSPIEQRQIVADELDKDDSTEVAPDIDGDLAKLRRAWAQACAEARKQFLNEVAYSKAKKVGSET
jgi:ParB family chromosome partitioning protein